MNGFFFLHNKFVDIMTSDEEDYDNDVEISDDDNCEDDKILSHLPPFPDENTNENMGKELFSICFQRRYYECPSFYSGFLAEAFHIAFNSFDIHERLPLLVYIHNDTSLFTNPFCSNTFCTSHIIEYLFENYLIWPWDITLETNKTRLIQIWMDIFSTNPFQNLSIEQYPILIGITRSFIGEQNSSLTSEYNFKILLQDNQLLRFQQSLSRETLLDELKIFKKEFNQNERILSNWNNFRIFEQYPDIIDEIIKYLPLNDIINVFTPQILHKLYKDQVKVHVHHHPNNEVLNNLIRKLHPEQIISLDLQYLSTYSKIPFISLSMYAELISLTLMNCQNINHIIGLPMNFPNLRRLSLKYDYSICLRSVQRLWNSSLELINRLEISCADLFDDGETYAPEYSTNNSIQYFLLDVKRHSLNLSYSIKLTIDFIKNMFNLRYFWIITQKNNQNNISDFSLWINLIQECPQLRKGTVFQVDGSSENKQKKVLEIKRSNQ
ncbi:hypothetical protein I4U23_022632 [Adineta vaga]|nr:hypothetical protein I4U23_022632 [Adineta vaga]